MLKVENVYKTFNAGTVNEKRALKNLNLSVAAGEFVTVIGGNGAGKSTMLNTITGAYTVDYGSVEIDGVDVTKLPEHKRAQFIGRVFQDPMMGTADRRKSGAGSSPRQEARSAYRHHQWGAGRIQEAAGYLGSGSGRPHDRKGRSALRRPETGADPAHGDSAEAQAVAAGRTHRSAGPQDRSQGSGDHSAHR